MARKKVNLQLITNSWTRRATFKRRCKGLMKKASELVKLCGAKVCVVVYGEGKIEPEVWPTNLEARRLLTKYRDMPELGNFKKTKSQKDLLNDRLTKLRVQMDKSESENYERETLDLLHDRMNGCRPGLFNTSTEELTSLRKVVDERNSLAKERLRRLGVVYEAEPMVPQLQLLPGSSQPQDPYTGTERQMPMLAEEQQPQQQDWLVNWPPNCSAFLGSNSDSAGPSCSGRDMMQPYNPGCESAAFSWTCEEWEPFPHME